MKTASGVALSAIPNGAGNGNGHHPAPNGNGAAAATESAVLLPHLTPQGLKKLLQRENNPCGPGLLATRIRAVAAAEKQEEAKLLAGALEDLAAAAVGYSYRVRAGAGIWPKPVKPKPVKSA